MAMAQAASRVPHPGRVKVGERVGIGVGGRVLAAEVIEDRGNLGVHGEQVVRLAVEDPMIPSERFEIEVPAGWLEAPPARARR